MRLTFLLIVLAFQATFLPISAQRSDAIRLRFPDGVDLTGLSIHYFLRGPFGGYGSFVRTVPNVGEYAIPITHEGQRATSLAAIIYRPGSPIVLFTREDLTDQSDEAVTVSLEPLSTIPLVGRIQGLADSEPASLEVVYLAFWSHDFYGIVDGALVSFTVATTPVRADGSFATSVPDFVRDRVIASRPTDARGSFLFRLHTGGAVRLLERVGQIRGRLLPIADSYPRLELGSREQ